MYCSTFIFNVLEAIWMKGAISRLSGKKASEIIKHSFHLDKVSKKSLKKHKKVFIVRRIADFFWVCNLNKN